MGLEKYSTIKLNPRAKKALDEVKYKLNAKGEYFYTFSDTILYMKKNLKKGK